MSGALYDPRANTQFFVYLQKHEENPLLHMQPF